MLSWISGLPEVRSVLFGGTYNTGIIYWGIQGVPLNKEVTVVNLFGVGIGMSSILIAVLSYWIGGSITGFPSSLVLGFRDFQFNNEGLGFRVQYFGLTLVAGSVQLSRIKGTSAFRCRFKDYGHSQHHPS